MVGSLPKCLPVELEGWYAGDKENRTVNDRVTDVSKGLVRFKEFFSGFGTKFSCLVFSHKADWINVGRMDHLFRINRFSIRTVDSSHIDGWGWATPDFFPHVSNQWFGYLSSFATHHALVTDIRKFSISRILGSCWSKANNDSFSFNEYDRTSFDPMELVHVNKRWIDDERKYHISFYRIKNMLVERKGATDHVRVPRIDQIDRIFFRPAELHAPVHRESTKNDDKHRLRLLMDSPDSYSLISLMHNMFCFEYDGLVGLNDFVDRCAADIVSDSGGVAASMLSSGSVLSDQTFFEVPELSAEGFRKCPFRGCDKIFYTRSAQPLSTHMSAKHGWVHPRRQLARDIFALKGEGKGKCPKCGVYFHKEKTLAKHLQNDSCKFCWPRHPKAAAFWGSREKALGRTIKAKIDPNVNISELAINSMLDFELRPKVKRVRLNKKRNE